MITLSLKDLLKNDIYVVRYLGKQHFKTSSMYELKQLERALRVLKIKDYHVYHIHVRKEN